MLKRNTSGVGLTVGLALLIALLLPAAPAPALETVATFAGDCATPKAVFQLGDTVCAKVTGVVDDGNAGIVFLELVAPSGTVVFGGPGSSVITTNSQNFTHALATTGLGAERGRWQARTANVSDSSARVTAIFRVPRMSVIGVRRDTPGSVFFFRNSNTTGFGEGEVAFGLPGDVGLMGDWDGDGVQTPGVYRPSEGTFYLANSPVGANADVVFAFGPLGGTPVVGDWNGDGITTIGIYKDDAFHLRNSNSGGPADATFNYGLVGDLPVVGDWDGDGTDTVGVYRDGIFFLRNSNSAGVADLQFFYGLPGDSPVAGNWTAASDGKSTIGIYRSTDGTFYLRNSNDEGIANIEVPFGVIGDQPLVSKANEAPEVTAGGTLPYTEGQAATAIDSALTVTDMDSAVFVGATAQITTNCASGEDVLSFTDQNGISGVYTAAGCLMTLSGRSSVANYQAALRTVRYQNSSTNPSTLARTVTWEVDDGAVVNAFSDPATSTITVTATNDAPTDISLLGDTVGESLPVGTVVGTFTATDPNGADTHTFSLVAGAGDDDNASFTIDGNQLKTAVVLDFETKNTLSIRVQAADSGTGNLTFDKSFTINVADGNDPPTDIGLSPASVPENQPVNTAVGTLTATDPNGADTHTFTLVTGAGDTDNASFNISGTQLRTSAIFDFEIKNSYTVRVRATDNGTGNLFFEKAFTISVTDVNEPPVGVTDKAHAVTGNVRIQVAAGTLLAGVTEPEGQGLVAQVDGSNASQGNITINANGSYLYNPKAGFTGSDTVKFKVCDNQPVPACSPVANLVLTVSNMLWFIDNNAAAGGSGRLTNPFSSLAEFVAVNLGGANQPSDNHVIFIDRNVATDYTGPLTLRNGQKVLGKGGSPSITTFAGFSLAADSDALPSTGGTAPNITTTTGTSNAVTVASGNTLRGFTIGDTTGVGIRGNGFGTLTIDELSIGGAGQALNLTTGTLAGGGFGGITSTSTGAGGDNTGNNVLLTGVATSAPYALGGGTLSGATSDAFKIDGQNGTFTYSGTVTNTSTLAVNVLNKTGGAVTLSGNINPSAAAKGVAATSNTGATTITFSGASKKISAGAGTGVALTNNTGSTVTFSNGGLVIDTAAGGTGFSATDTGSSTLNVTGSGNTISGAGQALSINSSAGANAFTADVTFDSVGSTGGARNVFLQRVNGTVAMNGGALSGATTLTVDINLGTASVTYAGTINATRGISVTNKTGGTVLFSAATKTLNTAGTPAVTLTSNTGATINFTNGGLDIDTTTGAGFAATGGGTVNVTGSNNTINSVSATALNVSNTNIGASNLNFVSISAGNANADPDPASGIILNTTGASGGLIVAGDAGSTNNGTGGLIQNTTSHGISLNSTRNVSLDQLNISGTGDSGINGVAVTNFTYTNGTITNAGNASFDSAIAFNGSNTQVGNNIAGTLTVTGSVFTNPFFSGLDVQATDGTVTSANVSSNTITNPGFSGINFSTAGTAATVFNLNDATINQNNISSAGANGIQFSMGNGSATGPGVTVGIPNDVANRIDITNNSVSTDSGGTQAITMAVVGGNSGSRARAHFLIECNGKNTGGCTAPTANAITGSLTGHTVLIGNNGFSTMVGTVNNNVIDSNHTAALSASNAISGGNGVGGAGTAWTPDLTLTVTNNVVTDTDGNGILLVGRGATGIAKLKITGNTVAAPLSGLRPGIRVDAGNAASADDAVCLNISGNTSAGSGGAEGIGVRKEGSASATTNDFGLQGIAQVSPTNPQVEAYVEAQNPAGGGAFVISGNQFSQCATAPL